MKFLLLALVVYTVNCSPYGLSHGYNQDIFYATRTSFREADCWSGVEVAHTCRGSYPAYYFDVSSKSCRHTTYGGCSGINTFFQTLDECDYVARTVCRPAVTRVVVPQKEVVVSSPVREVVRSNYPYGRPYGYGRLGGPALSGVVY